MRGRPVTDPALLAQLEGGDVAPAGGGAGRPVTDPGLLAQLEREDGEAAPQSNFDPAWYEKLAPNILSGLAQGGHALINAPSNIGRYAASKGLIKPETAEAIPRQQDYDYSAMLKLPGTTADTAVQSVAKNLPAILMPGPAGKSALLNALGRTALQGGWGAVSNENPAEGAKEFGGIQAIMEALHIPAKGLGWLAEQYNPLKYAKGKIENIADLFRQAKGEQKKAYSHMDPYKDTTISADPNSLFNPDDIQHFSPAVKKVQKIFLADPTLGNAHRLQSQMFSSMSKIKATDQAGTFAKEAMQDSRETLQNLIKSHLNSLDMNAAEQYEKGRAITRDTLAPLQSTPTLRKITRGRITDLTPKQLASTIQRGYESEKINPGHALMKHLTELQNRMARGQTLQNIIPPAMGGLLGGLGGSMGALGGAAFGKYTAPTITAISQNPWLIKMLEQLQPYAHGAARAGVGYNMQGE